MDVDEYLRAFDRRDWQETTDGTVRFAMIALGWWTREQAIPAIEKSDLCEVTVVASGDEEKAEEVAGEHETIEHAITYDEFQEGEAVDAYDAVYVCTPNALHLPYVESAAEHGKAVLCEKPIEADVERAEQLVDAAEDVTLMIAYRMHTEPAIRRAKELIDDGVIGDPALVQGTMTQRILDLVPDPDQWRLDPDLVGYGSSVMDIGIYPLNTTRFLLEREPERASASAVTLNEEYEDVPDERVAFQIEYEGGVLGGYTASQNAYQESYIRVTGTEGRIVIEPSFFPWTDRGFELSVNDERMSVEWEQVDQMEEEFEYFAHCLLTGEEPYADGEHGLLDLRTIETIYESAASGEREEI